MDQLALSRCAQLRWVTYDLVDLGDLGLEDGDGVTDGGLLGSASHSGGSEAHGAEGSELSASSDFGKHFLLLINIGPFPTSISLTN